MTISISTVMYVKSLALICTSDSRRIDSLHNHYGRCQPKCCRSTLLWKHRGTVGITVDADGVGHLELPPTWTDSALVEIVAPQTLLASFLRVSTTHEIE